MTKITDRKLHRKIDPRLCNVALDNNALDRPAADPERCSQVDLLLGLVETGTIRVLVPRGVRLEAEHPATPAMVKAALLPQIFTLDVEPSEDERQRRERLRAVVEGNAEPGKHAADIDHLDEAGKYACYFVTHDRRLLKRSQEISEAVATHLQIVTLAEFLAIVDRFMSPPLEPSMSLPSEPSPVDMQRRSLEKAHAVAAIGTAIAGLKGQEPDDWERECLGGAVEALVSGCYGLAVTGAANAILGKSERVSPAPERCRYSHHDLALLTRVYSIGQAEQVRPWPHLGPVIFGEEK